MHIRKSISILSFFLAVSLSAQTARWKVTPEYSEITSLSPSLLRVEKNGLYGLLGTDGRIIVPCQYEAVTAESEDRCLLLSSNGRLITIYDRNGKIVRKFAENEIWYIDSEYPYYSEGLLAVSNGQGRWTYMDKSGNPATKNPEFRSATPFFHGYAVVRYKDGSYMHINAQGQVSKLSNQFKDNYLVYASSFTQENSGAGSYQSGAPVSVIVDSGNNVFMRDRSGGKVSSFGVVKEWNKKERIMTTDRYRIEFEPNRQIRSVVSLKDGIAVKFSPALVSQYSPSVDRFSSKRTDKGYNLMLDGKEILPSQFEEFPRSLSPTEFIARKNGVYGIIEINGSYSADIELQQFSLAYSHHTPMPVRARLSIDPSLDSGQYRVLVRAKGITLYDGTPDGSVISFDYVPHDLSQETSVTFDVSVDVDGIRHPGSVLKQAIAYENPFSVKIPWRVKLNEANTAGTVSVTIDNTSVEGSDLCDIIVDGQILKRGVRFQGKSSMTVSVAKPVNIQDLDSVEQTVTVQIRESGCPTCNVSRKVTFERNL